MTFIGKLKSVMLVALGTLTIISAPAYAAQTSTVDDRHINNQIICLAQNAYFEARNQPLNGQIAVMNVVMNRSNDYRFPSTPCGIVHQKTGRTCQFSWVCSGRASIKDSETFTSLKELAYKVYTGKVSDVTNGAKFFHAKYVNPKWNLRVTKVIGSHIFYR